MELDTNFKGNKKFFKKIKLKTLIIGAVSVVLIAVVVTTLVLKFGGSGKSNAVEPRTVKAAKGNISVMVTGSGPIASSNESEVTSSVTGKITKIYFKEGDTVKKGDLLFELDDSDAKLNVEKIKNSIAQAQLTMDTNSKSLNNLDIRAPYDGQITNLTALKGGDDVPKGSTLFTITDTSKLNLEVSFSGSMVNQLRIGQKVNVNIQNLMQTVEGTITYINTKPTTTGSGGEVYNTDITISNPGSLKAGMQANAEVDTKSGTQMSATSGQLEYVNTQVVRSVSGGTVKNINIKENQFVKAGQLLMSFSNDDLEVSAQTNDLKMQDLQNQLETAEKQLSEYKIYSPLDGIVVSQELKVGNSVKPADVLTVITDPGHMEFDVSIDELDIAKIKAGQKVNITIDALTETSAKPLSGQVSKIAIEGTSSNGVTTYPVTIQVNETSNLKVGMNANAEIIVSEKADTLLVPLEAVQKMGNRSFVFVKGDGKTQGQNPWGDRNSNGANSGQNSGNRSNGSSSDPNGSGGNFSSNNNSGSNNANSSRSGRQGNFAARANSPFANGIPKAVEVGISNDEYIEILSGLNEGDEVLLPQLSAGTTQTNQQMTGGFGMGGGFGGGMGGGFNAVQRASGGSQRSSSSRNGTSNNLNGR